MICDLCNSDQDVQTLTVVWNYKAGNPWELDLCHRCYESRMGDMADMGRRAQLRNIRPQHRLKKTELLTDK